MDNTIQIAERIKKLRKNPGLNQSEFCKKLGIKQSTLSSYENGTVAPSNEVLHTIAKQYHISLVSAKWKVINHWHKIVLRTVDGPVVHGTTLYFYSEPVLKVLLLSIERQGIDKFAVHDMCGKSGRNISLKQRGSG